jgi:hypothetical protein
MWELGLFAFIVGIYWLNSSQGKRYRSQRSGYEKRKELLREHEQMKERARTEDARCRMRGYRRS